MENGMILVIGNGFDLNCGLKSSFRDFLKYCKKENNEFYSAFDSYLGNALRTVSRLQFDYIIRNIGISLNNYKSDISFWELYIYMKDYKTSLGENWFDVESSIDLFVNNKQKELNLDLLREMIIDDPDLPSIPNTKIERKTFERYTIFAIQRHFWQKNLSLQGDSLFTSSELYKQTKDRNKTSYYRFLQQELVRFEEKFMRYLHMQLSETLDYNTNAEKLIKKIQLNVNGPKLKSDFYMMNFNYTLPKSKSINKNGTNVHGYIGDDISQGSIIIGIDQTGVNADGYSFLFSKTYRKLSLKKNLVNQALPKPQEVSRIVFYGHSLSEADYSYFYSLFEYYRINSSEVELDFCYSIYDKSRKVDIENQIQESVKNLLWKYGHEMQNGYGKNLMHRMLLEQRIRLISID